MSEQVRDKVILTVEIKSLNASILPQKKVENCYIGKDRVIQVTDAFIRDIPKTDLHLHLDGSVRLETLIELAKQQGVELPASTPEGLREKVFKDTYKDLPEYLQGFQYTTAVMRIGSAMERIAYELGVDCFKEGIRYIEVRFAPQLHIDPSAKKSGGDGKEDGDANIDKENNPLSDCVSAIYYVSKGLKRASEEWNSREEVKDGDEPGYGYGIICCAMRMIYKQLSPYYRSLCALHEHEPMRKKVAYASRALVASAVFARDELGLPVVGIDMAGAEKGFPAEWNMDAFNYAKKNFMNKTVHAGEGYGPGSIFQAITDLHASRIGHGFHLFSWDLAMQQSQSGKTQKEAKQYVSSLVEWVCDKRITLEVCLTSNLQTMPELKGNVNNHVFGKMVDRQLSVTLCTDNRLVSNTTIPKEYRLAIDNFGLTLKQLRDITICGFKRSFSPEPYKQKREYVRKAINYFDAMQPCVSKNIKF
eukprot:jgi/Bigna1/57641/fgenesh1_pm.22_\